MTDERKREGAAETLRGAVAIVIAGIALGLAFNALGLASHPPRGLSWIARPERMPTLEELQPGSGLAPSPTPRHRPAPAFSIVGTAWAREAAADSVKTVGRAATVRHAAAKRAAAADTAKAARKRAAAARPAAKGPPAAARKPAPVPKPVRKATAVAPAVPADLPVVPDLDRPIEVKLAFAKRFFDADGAVFVDAREAAEYEEGHIAGARSVPFDAAVAKPALLDPFRKAGRPLILYCSGGDCELSKDLATNMLAEGIRKVLVFTEGFPAWKAAGYPVETGPAKAAP